MALTFPDETGRGLGFALEQQTDGGWQLRAYLTSAPDLDVVEIPAEVGPGSYRICTAMSGDENTCTGITIQG